MNSDSSTRTLWALRSILIAGLVLRAVVFFPLRPSNNDKHYLNVQYIAKMGHPPTTGTSEEVADGWIEYDQSYQPPLYYVLAIPWHWMNGEKGVQLFSVLLSMANLCLLYRLLQDRMLIGKDSIRIPAMLMAALMPQFVLFGSYVSNDALAMLVGTLCFAQLWRYLRDPTRGQLIWLAIVLGIGLLTKGTFLAFAPVLVLAVVIAEMRSTARMTRGLVAKVAMFICIACAVGSYKFVENTIRMGRPIVHNLDFSYLWVMQQLGTHQGMISFVDINVAKLVQHPVMTDHTRHSWPLMMYGTLWYRHLPGESNFTSATSQAYVAPAIYLLAIVPTLLIVAGWWRMIRSWLRGARDFSEQFKMLSALILGSNFVLVIALGAHYDVWSCFQGRLLFPSMAGLLLALVSGLELLDRMPRALRAMVGLNMIALFVSFVAFFIVEIGAL